MNARPRCITFSCQEHVKAVFYADAFFQEAVNSATTVRVQRCPLESCVVNDSVELSFVVHKSRHKCTTFSDKMLVSMLQPAVHAQKQKQFAATRC